MRSKELLSIVAFAAAFAVSVLVTPRPASVMDFANVEPVGFTYQNGFSKPATAETRQSITALLSEDIENGQIRNSKYWQLNEEQYPPRSISSLSKLSEIVDEYASASDRIDYVNLPADFRKAWSDHMEAWRFHAEYLKSVSDSDTKVSRSELSINISLQDKEISDTWREVLRVARQYDAYIPPGAY